MNHEHFIQSQPTKINLLRFSFVLITFLLTGISSHAKTYYFSTSGNDAYTSTQAQNQATPWKSITKLNSIFSTLLAGDNIFFKKGETFYGSIVVNRSGSSGKPITFGAYGTGSNPVITGLTTLSSWTSVSNGIYQSDAATVKSTVNLVTLNGAPQAVGRYPNAGTTNGGYLAYESYSGTSSITDNQLSSSTNWTGAEVVIRKKHFIMERCKITGHSGGTLSYAVTSAINPNANPAAVTGTNGYGYFIQRDARTLDQLGEWYFNTSTKKMQMYFGSNSPSSYAIRVSTEDNLINIGSQDYISINNISLEGGNVAGIYVKDGGNITVQTCDINLTGGKGIFILNSGNILVEAVNINNVATGAIDINSGSLNNATIRNCTIKNTGMIAGMGCFWSDTDYKGICLSINSGALIEYNSLENTGFMGIQFVGSNITIKNNFVNFYNIVKDDGGGIYTYQTGTDASPGTVYTNRIIRENIVMNGVGAMGGSLGNVDVDGIFLDGRVTNVDILNNSIANVSENGIYCNNSINVNIRGNTCFNNGSALGLTRYTLGYFSNLSVKQNIFYPKTATQDNFRYNDYGITIPTVNTIQGLMQKLGKIDSNYFANPNPTGFTYYYALVKGGTYSFPSPITFDLWKTFTGHDKASKLPPISIKQLNIDDQLHFEYNATNSPKTVTLDGTFLTPDNISYSGSVTLAPYTSKILIRQSTSTAPPTGLKAAATATKINCFGGSSTVAVSSSGGVAPYTGTGSYTVTAGVGSLKLSAVSPLNYETFVDAPIGAISSGKNYVLRFTTLGTTANGSLSAGFRKTNSPYTNLASLQTKSFGTSRTDHQLLFIAPSSDAAASFVIQLQQSSGTTYIDNIAVFETSADGTLISNNLYANGDFTSNIADINTWSENNNHTASWDGTSKINATYYYPVIDATGAISVTTVNTSQPAQALQATATAVPYTGTSTSVTVSATGGTSPYTGTGVLTGVRSGTYNYTVTDANGCFSTVTIIVKRSSSARTAQTSTVTMGGKAVLTNLLTDNAELKIASYPNPTTNVFGLMVEGGTNEKVGISVMSVDGRIVYQTTGTSNRKYTFGSAFGTGIYVIRVIQGINVQTLKAIKNK